MLSEGEFGNRVMTRLGESPVADINSPSDSRAVKLKQMLDDALKHLMNEAEWAFAKGYFKPLKLNEVSPYEDFPNVFELPNDVHGEILVFEKNTPEYALKANDYDKQSGKIYTHFDEIYYEYRRFPAYEDLPRYIHNALIELAADKMTGTTMGQEVRIYFEKYSVYLRKAMKANRDGIPQRRYHGRLGLVRSGYYYGGGSHLTGRGRGR